MQTPVSELVGNEWGLYIDGKTLDASDNGTFTVIAPANGEKIATVAAATTADVDAAVTSAHAAFLKWSQLSGYDREKIIRKATAHVRTQADRIGMLMALEQGKPFNQSKSEIIASCDTIDYYAAEAVRIEGYTNPTEKSSFRSWVIYQPVGVCAVITPWNYPVSLLSWKLGPALATGSTVVVKPTTITPLSPTAFCMALTEGGLPEGIINVVNGSGSKVGEALLQHPLVEKVAMTGSSATGRRLMEVYAPSLKKISLELGGHCPAIVCADADLDNAAQVVAYKGFRNDGQSCSSVNRVYVHETVKDVFVEKLKTIAEKMSIGDGISDGAVDLGPMCTKDGVATSVEHVRDALANGATLVTGGKAPAGEQFIKGNYYLPTILTNVAKNMKVMVEETFGPVVPVDTYNTIEEAIAKANDTNYGLVSYLFTKDFKTTLQVSEALQTGTVAVNTSAVNTNYAPYAGWKESGYGVELSRKAVFEYLKTKHIKVEML
jgi:succinate-semialdehyde dehydrogenase / glutarate-semialdehyde dehydrogenase